MPPIKVLVTGAVGSGKTTFVSTLSDIEAVTTDVNSDEPQTKDHTTVGLDYGRVAINNHSVRLFGTPGQDRFDYMWEILGEGAEGIVLLVHSAQLAAIADTDRLINTLLAKQSRIPLVVGITHVDQPSADPEQLRAASFMQHADGILPIDARVASDNRMLIEELLNHIGH